MLRFLHTADWQIGKPFESVENSASRESLRRARLEAVDALAAIVAEENLAFAVVCGDLFDAFCPDQATVSALCAAVGKIPGSVYALPGNHDHAGPGSVWSQAFFEYERSALAPNLTVLQEAEPVIRGDAVLFPCPLRRRQGTDDPSTWLRAAAFSKIPKDRPWIVMAHGAVQNFAGQSDGEAVNLLRLEALPPEFDYIALGDWHSLKQVSPRAWYPGTPEQDRYSKGENYQAGNVLAVELETGTAPLARAIPTGKIRWHILDELIMGDGDIDAFESRVAAVTQGQVGRDCLRLNVHGALSLSGTQRFEAIIERLRARLLDLRLSPEITVEASADELAMLTSRDDPLVAAVAQRLAREIQEEAEPQRAQRALRELFTQLCQRPA